MKENRSEFLVVALLAIIFVCAVALSVMSYGIAIDPLEIHQEVAGVKALDPAQAIKLSDAINAIVKKHTDQDRIYRQIGGILILSFGLLVYGLYHSIKLRKRIFRLQLAQYRITQVLAEHCELRDAAQPLLKAIAETTHSELGCVWIVDPQENKLKFVNLWHSDVMKSPGLIAINDQVSFDIGVSIPGRVWQNASPLWIPDMKQEHSLPRIKTLLDDGFQSAFAFPIRIGQEIVGVMEFFSSKISAPDKDLLSLCDSIGSQIGQFIVKEHTLVIKDENERRLQTLTEAIPVIVWTADRHGQIDFFNSRLVEYTGLSTEQSMDEAWKLLIHPEDRLRYGEEWQHAIKTGDTFELEFRLRRAAGIPRSEYRWQLGRAVAMRDPDGTIQQWYGTWTDIESQKAGRPEQ